MGYRHIQRILVCGWCENTPEDGETLWEMGGDFMCQACSDKLDQDEGEAEE